MLLFSFCMCDLFPLITDATYRSFRDYGEAVLQHLENYVKLDRTLKKAPVNYEGVSLT